MRFVMLYHSLVSDWNHGNAHFLRGVATELMARGHEVAVWEPADAWSRENLVADHGEAAVARFEAAFPGLRSRQYRLESLDVDEVLDGADVVLVHEWSDHGLVRRVGERRARGAPFRLLFHDTHHRALTDERAMAAYDLRHYDGVLAFGAVLRDIYLRRAWTQRAWVWHEAADTRLFRPADEETEPEGDLVWVGNWGDEERSHELREFLIEPVRALGLRARVHGVRYPAQALRALAEANIAYGGWVANFEVPRLFARHRVTVHVPRRPYVEALRGIPTIRPFEALACGIPLVSSPWEDAEGLFRPGDFEIARSGAEMARALRQLVNEPETAHALAARGLETIRARHTCAHRVDELLAVVRALGAREAEEHPAHPTETL